MTKIEMLYFDGCPGYRSFLPDLRELIAEAGLDDRALTLRPVESEPDAVAERFLGSPTVRVDGVDVEPGAEARDDFGLKCRLYPAPGGLVGVPRREWVLDALSR